MPKIIFMIVIGFCMTACGLSPSEPVGPTPAAVFQNQGGITLASYAAAKGKPQDLARQNCVYPAGWQAYTVSETDTRENLAARLGLSVEQLLQSNCLSQAFVLAAGQVVYVPAEQNPNTQTILPLAVTHFVADPAQADPNQVVRLVWAGQGPIQNVRVGSLSYGQYTELATKLPANGMLEVLIPDDGQDVVNYVVIVGDGVQEVYAQTSVRVSCEDAWFFAPAPNGCPSSLLATDFVEQRFVNGTVVYIPALGLHYVMVRGQEAVSIEDNFIPGISPLNRLLPIPAGFVMPRGAILHLWQNEVVQQSLGYAVERAKRYEGKLQRTMSPSGEIIYLSSGDGDIYRLGKGLVWGVILMDGGE